MKKAFTMVELIIVVIIIGILASFAVPAYMNAQNKAKAKQLFADMELLMAAEKIYRTENGDWLECWEPLIGQPPISCNQALRLNMSMKYGQTYSLDFISFKKDECNSGVHCLIANMTFPSPVENCVYSYMPNMAKPVLEAHYGSGECPAP